MSDQSRGLHRPMTYQDYGAIQPGYQKAQLTHAPNAPQQESDVESDINVVHIVRIRVNHIVHQFREQVRGGFVDDEVVCGLISVLLTHGRDTDLTMNYHPILTAISKTILEEDLDNICDLDEVSLHWWLARDTVSLNFIV